MHALYLHADDQCVAELRYDAQQDHWQLDYPSAWVAQPGAYPLSPALPLAAPAQGYAPGAIKRFIENLLPEGRALDMSASTYQLAKSNIFGLIRALGAETAGAFSFSDSPVWPEPVARPQREVTLAELDARIAQRQHTPFVQWDGRVRMSIAGYQDKLLVYRDPPQAANGRLFLVEAPLASTHILKPEPDRRPEMPHLVVNEHFCMRLAQRMGLPVAAVELLRTPSPVLVVTRFDRQRLPGAAGVRRLHVIDTCQASDLPVSGKYEHNLGSAEAVRHIRDGVSLPTLFAQVAHTSNKAAARLTLLRWALFQFLIGNCDAHGKNFSFFVQPGGLSPAPWYDLVSVVPYPSLDHELAMAWGDVFNLDEVSGFALADFASRCQIDRRLLQREAQRLAKLAQQHAPQQAQANDYLPGHERDFVLALAAYVEQQAQRLVKLAAQAVAIPADYL